MSNNFCKRAVLKKKKKNYKLIKATQQRILLTNFRGRYCFRFSIYLSAIFHGNFSRQEEKFLQTNV